MSNELMNAIRSVPDFPKKGIMFRDITTLLKDPEAFTRSIDLISQNYSTHGIQKVVGIESRGFVFGAPVAYKLNCGFVPVRKPGKLPAATLRQEYALEYGSDAIEIHKDAITPGERVLMVDDLLATGGTMAAACQLVEKLGGKIVGVAFLIELAFLPGRSKLNGYDVSTLIKYDKE